EPEPEPEQEPPPPPELLPDHLKMVEQMDEFDEAEVPDSYEFLSNINRAVLEQTRAMLTNLIEDANEASSTQLEPSEEPEKGDAAEDEIAEKQQEESQLAHEAPRVKVEQQDQRTQADDPVPKTELAMRELAPQSHEEAMLERQELARESPDGTVASEQDKSASLMPQEAQARSEQRDERSSFTLSANDMRAAFGEDLDAARKMASEDRSKKKGVWDDVRDRYESPLENVVPEI